MIEVIRFSMDNDALYQEALGIRRKVFIEEQQVPVELEVENEAQAAYYLLRLDGKAIGTARWRETDKGIKLERFAVLPEFRNRNLGTAMLEKVLSDLEAVKQKIYLHAQEKAVSYYQRQGFTIRGDKFVEAGIVHYEMKPGNRE